MQLSLPSRHFCPRKSAFARFHTSSISALDTANSPHQENATKTEMKVGLNLPTKGSTTHQNHFQIAYLASASDNVAGLDTFDY